MWFFILACVLDILFCVVAQAESVVVRKNDTLGKIAKRYNVSLNELKKMNYERLLKKGNFNFIKPGQVFELPIDEKSVAVFKSKVSKYNANIQRIRNLKSGGAIHISVIKGDTLSEIAVGWYGSSRYIKNIARENGIINPNKIIVGELLKFPDVGTIDVKNYNTSPYGAMGKRGNQKVLEGIFQSNHFPDMKQQMEIAVNEKEPIAGIIKKGDYANCVSDANGVVCNQSEFRFFWKKVDQVEAMIWENIVLEDYICTVSVINVCGNFVTMCKPLLEQLPKEESPKIQSQTESQPVLENKSESQTSPTIEPQMEPLPPEKKIENPYAGCEDLPKRIVVTTHPLYITVDATRMTCEERRMRQKEREDEKNKGK
ncbi:MAG: hypothetical protein US70_C0001G0006 [Parcubacteria group bacterium GW2011_GWD2_38_11]|nr:MAG: hypothetical protein US70_C0001G0006 [Parcubacteria group bacterium GW2011_GWD2_38_11]